FGEFARVDGGEDVDAISPDDGARAAAAGDDRFPFDVLLRAPLERRLGRGGDAGHFGAAPLGPVLVVGGVEGDGGTAGRGDEERGEREEFYRHGELDRGVKLRSLGCCVGDGRVACRWCRVVHFWRQAGWRL